MPEKMPKAALPAEEDATSVSLSPPATAALGVTTTVSTVGSSPAVRMFIVADPHVIALATGAFVGACVGAEVGAAEGTDVMGATGAFVGVCVGAEVGAAEGTDVMGATGAFVGVCVGAEVGAAEGTDVMGAAVGTDVDGAFVGAADVMDPAIVYPVCPAS